jgi:isopentenyl phosphate kinase
VGDIVSIDPSVVKALQDDAFIPVISPIGFGENNESYNINADVVAGKLATVLKAEKLVLLTNTPGVLDKTGKLLTDLTGARDRRDVRRRHASAAACCPRSPRRWTPPRAACTPCTSSTAGCRMRCCWRS